MCSLFVYQNHPFLRLGHPLLYRTKACPEAQLSVLRYAHARSSANIQQTQESARWERLREICEKQWKWLLTLYEFIAIPSIASGQNATPLRFFKGNIKSPLDEQRRFLTERKPPDVISLISYTPITPADQQLYESLQLWLPFL
jgi:hypothetical protein